MRIQGGAGAFVESLDGSFDNVMGFPTDGVREMLGRSGSDLSKRD